MTTPTPPPESTPPATVAPVAWGIENARAAMEPCHFHLSLTDAQHHLAYLNQTGSIGRDRPYRVLALYAADVPALMARIERAEAARDALRGEVAALRGARSAEDVCEMLCEASCVDVTPERCARIWSLLEHPATTMTTLAVIADERGESYAKVKAERDEAVSALRFYADEKTYDSTEFVDVGVGNLPVPGTSAADYDRGAKARAALGRDGA